MNPSRKVGELVVDATGLQEIDPLQADTESDGPVRA